jgi:hypothetical protein
MPWWQGPTCLLPTKFLPPTNKIPISLNQAKHPHWSPDIATWSQRRRVSSWEHASSHGHSEKRNTASCRMTGCSRGSGAYRVTSKLWPSETSRTIPIGWPARSNRVQTLGQSYRVTSKLRPSETSRTVSTGWQASCGRVQLLGQMYRMTSKLRPSETSTAVPTG